MSKDWKERLKSFGKHAIDATMNALHEAHGKAVMTVEMTKETKENIDELMRRAGIKRYFVLVKKAFAVVDALLDHVESGGKIALIPAGRGTSYPIFDLREELKEDEDTDGASLEGSTAGKELLDGQHRP